MLLTVSFEDAVNGLQVPPSDILPVLQWVFLGLDEIPITQIKPGFIAKQGPGNGEGSCGIITLNYIELIIGSRPEGLQRWNGPETALFRDAALHDLIQYHYIASQTPGDFSSWTSNILDVSSWTMDGTEVNMSIGSGYNDYNNFCLLVSSYL